MRKNFEILLVIVIALGLGASTAWYSIKRNHNIGGITIGPWAAWPFAGGAEADPYTTAKVAKDGKIPLGATEGLAFEAQRDNAGEFLTLDCSYLLSGHTPSAKLWTLTAYLENGSQVSAVPGSSGSIYSGNIVRNSDGSFRIGVSDFPVSGNWMGISGRGNFYLVMRIYDTPATSNTGLVTRRMPSIIRGACKQ